MGSNLGDTFQELYVFKNDVPSKGYTFKDKMKLPIMWQYVSDSSKD